MCVCVSGPGTTRERDQSIAILFVAPREHAGRIVGFVRRAHTMSGLSASGFWRSFHLGENSIVLCGGLGKGALIARIEDIIYLDCCASRSRNADTKLNDIVLTRFYRAGSKYLGTMWMSRGFTHVLLCDCLVLAMCGTICLS